MTVTEVFAGYLFTLNDESVVIVDKPGRGIPLDHFPMPNMPLREVAREWVAEWGSVPARSVVEG